MHTKVLLSGNVRIRVVNNAGHGFQPRHSKTRVYGSFFVILHVSSALFTVNISQ